MIKLAVELAQLHIFVVISNVKLDARVIFTIYDHNTTILLQRLGLLKWFRLFTVITLATINVKCKILINQPKIITHISYFILFLIMNIHINLHNYMGRSIFYWLLNSLGWCVCMCEWCRSLKKVIMRMKNKYFIKITFRINN